MSDPVPVASAVHAGVPSAFPGGTAVSRLSVYTSASIDGACGGTPHLHTASTEGYVVLSGTGVLQTIAADGFAERPLAAGTVLWFTPGTVHRLVNHGDLELLVVMGNAGLPEAGDAVMTFPDDVLADDAAYARAATLPAPAPGTPPGTEDAAQAAAAATRRDLGVQGFLTLRAAVEAGGADALARLHAHAARLVAPHGAAWRATWEASVGDETRATDAALTDLAAGRAPHLAAATVTDAPERSGPARFGMCGRLTTYDLTPPLTHPASTSKGAPA
jgi:mannose-6-phosphate isomerase-like protein (cupin superfamily)